MHSMGAIVNNTVLCYLKAPKRLNLKNLHYMENEEKHHNLEMKGKRECTGLWPMQRQQCPIPAMLRFGFAQEGKLFQSLLIWAYSCKQPTLILTDIRSLFIR